MLTLNSHYNIYVSFNSNKNQRTDHKNDQTKKDKKTNNFPKNTTLNTKD